MKQSNMAKSVLAVFAVLATITMPQSVNADNLPATFNTVGTVTSGGTTVNVNATAVFSMNYSTGVLSLDVTNNIIDAQNALQTISGIEFTVTPAVTKMISFTATGITIDLSEKPNLVSSTSVNFSSQTKVTANNVVNVGTFFDESVLFQQPDFTIIGWGKGGDSYTNPGTYTGNPSVTGDSHNPHVLHTAHFEFKLKGITNPSQVSNVRLEFGTTKDTYAVVTLTHTNSVPEPSSLALAGLGGIGMIVGAIRRRRAAV